MKRLCRRLNIPTWQAIGILESIWHLTAREAPRGDLGRLSDEFIALAIDYDGDEAALIEALVFAGWLDRRDEGRLVVHDWAEHTDDSIHRKLARAHQFFISGDPPKLSRLAGREREIAEEFYANNTVRSEHTFPQEEPVLWQNSTETGAQNIKTGARRAPKTSKRAPHPHPAYINPPNPPLDAGGNGRMPKRTRAERKEAKIAAQYLEAEERRKRKAEIETWAPVSDEELEAIAKGEPIH